MKLWPNAKVNRLLIDNVVHTILLHSLSPSRDILETVLRCTACTK